MAGSTTGTSIIWVAGETKGYNQSGELINVSGNIPADGTGLLSDAEAYADSAVDALHDRLVASGVLPS